MKAFLTLILCLVAFFCSGTIETETISKAEMEILIKAVKPADYIQYDSAIRTDDNRPGADNPYKLTYYPNATEVMLDGNRKELWSRYPAHHTMRRGYDHDYLDYISPNLLNYMNQNGTVVLMDTTRTRYMLIHTDGSEHLLPENSRQLHSLGYVHDRYWLFFARGDYDYEQFDYGGDGDGEYSESLFNGTFFDTTCGFLLVKDDGKIYKKVMMQNLGYIPQFSIDPNFRYIAYYWNNYYQNEPIRGWVLADINGRIIEQGASMDKEKKPPAWSEDGNLVLLWGDEKRHIINAADGNSIATFKSDYNWFSWMPDWAISNAGPGLVLFQEEDKLVLYCYKDKKVKQVLKYSEQNSQITELYLSGDGTEFGFATHSEKRIYKVGK